MNFQGRLREGIGCIQKPSRVKIFRLNYELLRWNISDSNQERNKKYSFEWLACISTHVCMCVTVSPIHGAVSSFKGLE